MFTNTVAKESPITKLAEKAFPIVHRSHARFARPMAMPAGLVVAALALLTYLLPTAEAQITSVATNVPGIAIPNAPPRDFDPVTAPDSLLALYGFPPRPDAAMQPEAHDSWARAMRSSSARITPHLEQTNVYHGPKRTGNSSGTSLNWSGSVDFGGANSYNHTNSFYYLIADYVVPTAIQAYGACTGGWDYSSSWIGIDGDGSNDVLQAGTESDAYCSGGSNSSYYSAWIEWFPFSETRITNFPVAPGDDLFIEVWNTSSTQGYAYLFNYRTNQSVSLSLTPPAGTSLIGNSAEWVVERPSVGGGLATLTNYVWDFFANCYAYTWSGVSYTPGTTSATQLTMLDNSSKPISYPTLLGTNAIWFRDEGSAY